MEKWQTRKKGLMKKALNEAKMRMPMYLVWGGGAGVRGETMCT